MDYRWALVGSFGPRTEVQGYTISDVIRGLIVDLVPDYEKNDCKNPQESPASPYS
jgi:hypothetical protein